MRVRAISVRPFAIHVSIQSLALRASQLFALLCYPILLFWIYAELISPRFAYLGYTFRQPPTLVFILTLVAAAAIGILLPRKIERPSGFLLWLIYLICISPGMTVGLYATSLSTSLSFLVSILLGFAFLVSVGICKLPSMRIRLPNVDGRIYWTILLLLTLGSYLYIGVVVGFHVQILSLADIYSARAEFKDALNSAPPFAGYLYPLLGNVLNPLLIMRGITRARAVPLLLGVAGELLLYATVGGKLYLFCPIALVLCWIIFKWFRRHSLSILVLAFAGGTAVLAVADLVLNINVLTSILTRRFIITPGIQTSAYVDTFMNHDLAYFSGSVLRWFAHYPYPVPIPKLVGLSYWHSNSAYSNGNIFADGFANLGFIGFFVVAVLLGLYLQALDTAGRGVPLFFSAPLVTMVAVSFTNTALFTTLLTGGGLFVLFAIYFLPRAPVLEMDQAATPAAKMGGSNGKTLSQSATRKWSGSLWRF